MLKHRRFCVCLSFAFLIGACGQSGALYMPDEAKKNEDEQQQPVAEQKKTGQQ